MGTFPLDPVRRPFRAAAEAFVPELAGADDDTWARLEDTVTAALAQRPPALRRQLVAFIRLVDAWALLSRGRPLARLAHARRAALLHGLERASLLALRRGVWGLRTLVFMGYYTQPAVIAALGYRADPAGWEAPR